MTYQAPDNVLEQRDDEFDAVAAGARFGLTPEVAAQIWSVLRGELTDGQGVLDLALARRRFDEVAPRAAARNGLMHTAPGKVSLLETQTWGRDPIGDIFRKAMLGSRSRVSSEARRTARRRRGMGRRARGGGGSLPLDVINDLAEKLGAAARKARIHVDADAADVAAEHNAHAVTYGEDVYFGRGEYQPDSVGGRGLIAHEVTHVAQSLRGERVHGRAKTAGAPSQGAGESEANVAVEVDLNKISQGFLKGKLKAKAGATSGVKLEGEAQVMKGPLKGIVDKIKVTYDVKTKELTGELVLRVDQASKLLPKGVSVSGTVTLKMKKDAKGFAFSTSSAIEVHLEGMLGGTLKDMHIDTESVGATFLPKGGFKLAGVEVGFAEGSQLIIDSKTGINGTLKGSVKLGPLPKVDFDLIRDPAFGFAVKIDSQFDLALIHEKLAGLLKIEFAGIPKAGKFKFDAQLPRLKDLASSDIFSMFKGDSDGKEITGKLVAKKNASVEYKGVKATIIKGEVELKPGRKLEGDLEGKIEAELATGTVKAGLHNGQFTWAASLEVDLATVTGGMLTGKVKAAKGEEGGTKLSGDAKVAKGPLKGIVDSVKVDYDTKSKDFSGEVVLSVDKLSKLLPKGVTASGTLKLSIKKDAKGVAFSTADTIDVKVESLLGGKIKDIRVQDGFAATFLPEGQLKLGPATVTFASGSKLIVDTKTGITGVLKGSVQLGSLPKLEVEISKTAKGIDVKVSTTLSLSQIHEKLDGQLKFEYEGSLTSGKFKFSADLPKLKDLPNSAIFDKLKGNADGKEITGKLTAKAGASVEYKGLKATIVKGEIALLPGKKVEGDLEAKIAAGIGQGEVKIGLHGGKFTWAASGSIDLAPLTGGMLTGKLSAGSGSTGGTKMSCEATVAKGPLKGIVDKVKVDYDSANESISGQVVLSVDKLSKLLPKGVTASGQLTLDIKKEGKSVQFQTSSTVDVKVESLLGGKIKDIYVGPEGFRATFLPEGTFKLGALTIAFVAGSKLTIDTQKGGLTGTLKGWIMVGMMPRIDLEVSRDAKGGFKIHALTTFPLSKVHPRLDGQVKVEFKGSAGGGGAAAGVLSFVADSPRLKDLPAGDIFQRFEGQFDGTEFTGKVTAKKGASVEYEGVKATIVKGELALLPGGKLEGDLEGTIAGGVGSGTVKIGLHGGKFTWGATGKIDLAKLTNNVLIGTVEGSAGTSADTTFEAKAITFGPKPLQGIKILNLSGNLTTKKFKMGVDATGLANKMTSQIKGVDIKFTGAGANFAYDNALKVDGAVTGTATVKAQSGKAIASGSFGLVYDDKGFGGDLKVDKFEISPYLKGNGLVIDLREGLKSGTVDFEIPKVAKGKVDGIVLNVKQRKYAFDAQIDFDGTQKLISGTKLHVKLADGVLSGDATFTNEYFGGKVTLKTGKGSTEFTGKINPGIKGLGKIGENFLGADIKYATGVGLTAKGGFKLDGLTGALGAGSKIEFTYAAGKIAVDGTLSAGAIPGVTYTGKNELKIHWEMGGKFSVKGQIDATVAKLADVTLKISAGATSEGTGEAELDPNAPKFYLSGKITGKGLQKYFPGVQFTDPTASVHVSNGADGKWDYAVDDVSTTITGINGMDEANITLAGSYAKGKGLSFGAVINKLRFQQFNIFGGLTVKDNELQPVELGMKATFPGVNLMGKVNITKGALGELSFKTHVEAIPSEGGPLSWVKSGFLDATMEKGKLKEVKGTLNLKPPSFLPVEDPKIEILYDGTNIIGTLSTDFVSPLHKTKKGNLKLTIGGPKKFEAEIRFPAKLPGMKEAEVYGKVTADGHVEIGATLVPDNLPFIKKAKVYVKYANGHFIVGGAITLAPTEDYLIELGVEYDITTKQFIIKGLEPKNEDKEKDKPLATLQKDKKFPSIPLFGIGVLNVVLTMRMGFGVNINKPFVKFESPKLIGGLDALDEGKMPGIEFGGRIGIGAEFFVEFAIGIAGQVNLLIATAEMGIEGVLKAGLTMNLQSDIHGKFEQGKPLELTIDPSVSAVLKLTAALNAFLFAEVLWWTIIDKKWPLASMDLADIPLGEFHPFDPFKITMGGGGGTTVETPKLKEDQSAMTEGAKNAGGKAGDDAANEETKQKVRPVLARIRQVARRFEAPPDWKGKGLTVAPVEFDSWYGIDSDKWDTYREVADNAEQLVPEEACKTPTEKLSKAVAVLSKRNPFLAGMLVLQWQRAQIAAQGYNPDTGEDVVAKQKEIEALVQAKYQELVIAWQAAVELQAQQHAAAIEKQKSDLTTAEGQFAEKVHADDQDAHQDAQKAEKELQAQKDKLAKAQGAAGQAPLPAPPPLPKPVPPPPPKLGKPAPIPEPPPIPAPPAPQPVPPVVMPALPADRGAEPPSAAMVPKAKAPKAPVAPAGTAPSPAPAPSSVAAASGSKSAVSTGGGGGGGGSKKATALPPPGGGGGGGSGTPSPVVVAGPQGIIVQDKSLDTRRTAETGGAAKPGAPGAPGAGPAAPKGAPAPAGGAPAPAVAGAKPPADAPAAPGAAPAAPGADAKGGAPGGGGGGGLHPTVQQVADTGKAAEDQRKQGLDAKVNAYTDKTDEQKKAAIAQEAKLKEAQAAAAGAPGAAAKPGAAAPPAPGSSPDGQGPDGAPGGEVKPEQPAAPPAQIGVAVPFSVLGESHTITIEKGVPTVSGPAKPVAEKLPELNTAIGHTPAIMPLAASSLEGASTSTKSLVAASSKAQSGDPGALSAVSELQESLAGPLKTTWEWAKVAADPTVHGGSIDKPLLHPYYAQFKERVAKLSTLGHITTVDATGFAESTWTKICQAVKNANPAMTDPAAYSNFAKGWLDMKSPQFQKAIGEFEQFAKEITKAASNQFATAKSFGFWSKDEGRKLSESISGLTLETSAIGTLMDGLPTLDGKKAGWDPEVWGGLSNAYANAVVPEILKGKKVNVCVGAGVPAGNIWEAVESVALEKGLRGTEHTLESVCTYYAAARETKANPKEPDDTKQVGGHAGCLFVGARPGAIAAADAHWKSLDDPPPPPAAPVGPAPNAPPPSAGPAPAGRRPARLPLRPATRPPCRLAPRPPPPLRPATRPRLRPRTQRPRPHRPPSVAPPVAAPPAGPATPAVAPATPEPTVPAAPVPPEQQKSKHGVGPAPEGWSSRVRGTTPSEAVASDDPGHTYHILDDDKVVATTEPVLLAPGSSVSRRATAMKLKPEQDIIAACQGFEIEVGNAMAGHADAAVQNLMSRVENYINAKIKPFAEDKAKVEDALKGLGSGLYEQWAGRISFKYEDIEAILQRKGNIREAITLFNSFVRSILEPDLAAGLAKDAMVELLQEVKGLEPDAKKREALAIQLYNDRKNNLKAGVDSVTHKTAGAQADTRTGALNADVKNENPVAHEQGKAGVASNGHIPSSDGRYDSDSKRTGTVDWKEGDRESDKWWLHNMTVDDFIKLGGVLSDREKKLFNEGVYRQALAARKESITDEASFKKAVAEAEAEAKKYVPWAAGLMGYDMKWNSTHAVMDAFHKLSVPVGAGVSGTTARTMQSLQAVNIDAATSLKICLGYLLPIQAHSFSEIRSAGAALGAGSYTPKRGSHNYNQAPITADVQGMADWAEFDRKYSPAAIGDVAAT